MGALKPLLPYGSGTVLQSVVRSLQACPVEPVLVVLGHRAAEIEASLAGTGATVLFNSRYQEGMLTSIQAGVAAAPPEAAWLVIALGDQPSLQPATIRLLLESGDRAVAEAGETRAPILVPSYGGRRGHPLVLPARLRAEIADLDPGVGLRELLQRRPDEIRHIVVPDETVLLDLDTPEEYRKALERVAGTGSGLV